MRKGITYFSLLLLLVACGSPAKKEQMEQATEGQEKPAPQPSEVQAEGDNSKTHEIKEGVYVQPCPTFFKVYKHNTTECYVNLCFKLENTMEDWQNLEAKCDSTVFSNDWLKRQRVPENEAAKLLEINGIRELRIFGTSGSMLPTSFSRIEYLDDLISGSFTAVFQCADSLGSDSNLYAILPSTLDSLVFKEGNWKCVTVGNEAKEDSVLGLVNSTYSTQWFFQTDSMTSSFSLSHSSFSTSVSSEFLSFGSTYKSVYELRDFHVGLANITRAFPTHYYLGNWPVWMVEISVPDTDNIYFQAVVPVNDDQLEISKRGKLCVN